jgi:hypothetical protein
MLWLARHGTSDRGITYCNQYACRCRCLSTLPYVQHARDPMTVSVADACENTDAQARMQACNHNGFKVSLLIVGMSIAHVLVWILVL